MPNEILFSAPATGSYKAYVAKGATVWNGAAMVATTASAKTTGAVTLTRQGTTLDYTGDFPALAAGRYAVEVIDAASPNGTEPPVGVGDMDWTGTAENVSSDSVILALIDTEVAAIKAKTDTLPATPTDAVQVAAVKAVADAMKLVTDKLDSMLSGPGPYVYTTAALVNTPAASGSVTLDLSQAVPTSPTAGTVGEALLAARAQGFGRWVKTGTSLVLYAPDGATVVRTFTLNDADVPTSRT